MRNKYLYLTLLAVLGWNAEMLGQARTNVAPRLVVNIAIDQFRGDLLSLFESSYGDDGFRKLLEDGMVFENATYPFRDLDKASAISSVVTGTTPFYHSITGEQWIDRKTLRPVSSTGDLLAVSTLSDELKISTQGKGKVFAVASQKNIASLSAGHAPDGIIWNESAKKKWTPVDVTEKALQCIISQSMGRDTIPDMLFITYDASGKDQSTYILLDQEIAKLLNETEKFVGDKKTLFVLTSTGYSEEHASDYEKYNIPTGIFYINRAGNLLNMYFGALWGQGRYVEASFHNQLYLNHQLLESKRIALTDALLRAKEFLLQMAGVKQISYHLFEDHIGDIVIEVAPGWQLQNEEIHEKSQIKTPLAVFPILVYGTGVHTETIKTTVSITQLAPAIAKAIRIRAPNACSSEPLF